MVKTNLRLDDRLYERIRRLATKENRSVNGEIVDMLEREVERREKVRDEKKD